jgi:hypothetical protein
VKTTSVIASTSLAPSSANELAFADPLGELGRNRAACFEIGESTGGFAWLLKNPRRSDLLIKPEGHTQPSFFEPF